MVRGRRRAVPRNFIFVCSVFDCYSEYIIVVKYGGGAFIIAKRGRLAVYFKRTRSGR